MHFFDCFDFSLAFIGCFNENDCNFDDIKKLTKWGKYYYNGGQICIITKWGKGYFNVGQIIYC